MAKIELTDKIVDELPKPKSGLVIVRDKQVAGFGVRVLPSGKRAFVLDYSIAGRRRVFTIGQRPVWKTKAAREEAIRLKQGIRTDHLDPAEEHRTLREAPTVKELCERFGEVHLPKLRNSTRHDYVRMIKNDILPALGNRKVAAIQFEDISKLHRSITGRGSPTAANFTIALCSKLFNVAIQLRMIEKNPVKGIERNRTQPRNRYLSMDEIGSLTKALTAYSDQNVADLFRLLLFTGARRGETQAATWDQFDLKEGFWTKPAHSTKQARAHRVPLAAPARILIARRRELADEQLRKTATALPKADAEERAALLEWRRRLDTFVFPSREGSAGHFTEIKKAWATICKAAGIVTRKGKIETHAARIHDLRHTAASVLASSGASLPLIGQLLGHTQPGTTARYAHLFDTAQRGAVERLGAIIAGGPSAEIVPLRPKKSRK